MAHVGFVGVGRMGANMARRLHEKGYRITAVLDRNVQTANELAQELGCEAAPSPARVAELSEVIVTVVSDDTAMREIYANDSLTSLLTHANGRLFLNCATLTPDVHVEIEQAIERQGGACLEACMASSYPGTSGHSVSHVWRQAGRIHTRQTRVGGARLDDPVHRCRRTSRQGEGSRQHGDEL